jgi:hypothetical protein
MQRLDRVARRAMRRAHWGELRRGLRAWLRRWLWLALSVLCGAALAYLVASAPALLGLE